MQYNITALEHTSVKSTVTLFLCTTTLRSGITWLWPEMKLLNKRQSSLRTFYFDSKYHRNLKITSQPTKSGSCFGQTLTTFSSLIQKFMVNFKCSHHFCTNRKLPYRVKGDSTHLSFHLCTPPPLHKKGVVDLDFVTELGIDLPYAYYSLLRSNLETEAFD
jgi:hypothetical protein